MRPMNVRNTVALMKIEILRGMEEGIIPENCASFSDLHDHIDANCLANICDDEHVYEGMWAEVTDEAEQGCCPLTEAGHKFISDAQDAVNAWLVKRAADLPAEPDTTPDEGDSRLDGRDLLAYLNYRNFMYNVPRQRLEVRLDRIIKALGVYAKRHDGAVHKGLVTLQNKIEDRIESFYEAQDTDKLRDFVEELQQSCSLEHGGTIVLEDDFEEYAQELAKDVGWVGQEGSGALVIDWAATARNLRNDFSDVDWNGTTYLVRNE